MSRDFIHTVSVLLYLLLGTVGVAFLVGWALKRNGLSGRPLARTLVPVPEVAEFSAVMSRVKTVHYSSRPMINLKQILVPIDFTESSLRALPHAKFFARQFGCTVTLLHVVQLNIVGEERGVPVTRYLDEMRSDAERTLECVAYAFGIPTAKIAIRFGAPGVEVLHEIAVSDVDLIILGRDQHSRISQVASPSVGRKIVFRAPCPSFVVV